MTDVFLSYSSKDRGGKNDPGEGGEDGAPGVDRVTPIVELLEAQGFEVFWDQQVPPGVNWNKWIKDKLSGAKCAIALWSGNSIDSDPVAHEATIAHKQGKLISVLIDDLDAEQVPMGLYTSQAVKLVGWTGDDDDENWKKILSAIEAKVTPHISPWLQRTIHALEADLAVERTRVKLAESRAKEMEKKAAKGAQTVLDAERERDKAVEDAAPFKAQLALSEKTAADLGARAKELEKRLAEIGPAPAVTARGGARYVLIAALIAFVGVVCSLGTFQYGPPQTAPLFTYDIGAGAAAIGMVVAFVLALIMLIWRRRRLGASELALYWLALAPPPLILAGILFAVYLDETLAWETIPAYFAAMLLGWLVLVLSAWLFARRGPRLTAPALILYWLGVWAPWLWTELTYAAYAYNGLPELYVSSSDYRDYSGRVVALCLALASGAFLAWRRFCRRA